MESSAEQKNTTEKAVNNLTSTNTDEKKRSVSETGHAKNVANLEVLISYCTAYGASYNPSKNNIKLANLITLRTNANTAVQNVKSTKTAWNIASNNREIAFTNLKKLSTRILNALEATDATKQTIADIEAIHRKIQGKRADNSSDESNRISVSQQSYDSQTDLFTTLVQRISMEPLYAPNETELKIATLNTLISTMKTGNTNAINTETAYNNALAARNAILYNPDTGLKDITKAVKKYVKSAFGATSNQYQQVNSLKFTTKKNQN